jgi:hypothetical protein
MSALHWTLGEPLEPLAPVAPLEPALLSLLLHAADTIPTRTSGTANRKKPLRILPLPFRTLPDR